jgi:hypothetical protein
VARFRPMLGGIDAPRPMGPGTPIGEAYRLAATITRSLGSDLDCALLLRSALALAYP